MVIVTLPALAVADVLLNLNAPLGSAESFSVPLAAPPPLEVDVEVVLLVVAGAAGVLDDVLLLLLLLPQPATARAATTATATTWSRFGFISPPSRVMVAA